MLPLHETYRDGHAERFVEDWAEGKRPRYLSGTNRLAGNLAGEAEGIAPRADEYADIYGRPEDRVSRDVFNNLANNRRSDSNRYLRGGPIA